MTEKLTNLLKQLGNKADRWEVKNGILRFHINGFSKSGTAALYEEDSTIYLETRYSNLKIINCYDDVVAEAYYWYESYKDRGYTVPDCWAEDFVRLSFVQKKVVTIYE
jgi:hypothetical protein